MIMKTFLFKILVFTFIFSGINASSQCIYVLNLYDSYGDGWNNGSESAYLYVYINNIYVGSATVSSGNNSASYNITASTNDKIYFSYLTNGILDSEHSFEVLDPWNNVVASGGNSMPSVNQGVASFYFHCTQPSGTPTLGNDCGAAPTVCSDDNITANSTGPGNVYELNLTNEGTLFNEHQSSWFYFHAQTSGSIEFTIAPNSTTDIYDFAVWDNSNCNPTSTPIRSSWASLTGNTGLVIGAGDDMEGNSGDKWLNEINATAGDEFLILVDNWSYSTNGFTLYWDLKGGSSLDCSPLPVEILNFKHNCETNSLVWETKSETNNNYFTIQKSIDSKNWEDIDYIAGAGNSNTTIKYEYELSETQNKEFYRLLQTDFDNVTNIINSIATSCSKSKQQNVKLYPNPSSSIVNISGTYNNIDIYNLIGEKLYNKISNNKIQNLETGVYIVVVDNTKKIKLIIN